CRVRRARFRVLSGDVAGGLADLLDAGRRFEAVGGRNPAYLPWRSHAALALTELGDHDEARRLTGEEVALARAWAAPRVLGGALRVAGVVHGGADGLALLGGAVEGLAGSHGHLEDPQAGTRLLAAPHPSCGRF